MMGRPKGSKDKKKRKHTPNGAFAGNYGNSKFYSKERVARELRGEHI